MLDAALNISNFVKKKCLLSFKNSCFEFMTLDDELIQEFYSLKTYALLSLFRFSKMSKFFVYLSVCATINQNKTKKFSAEFVFTIRMTLDRKCLTYFLSLFIIIIIIKLVPSTQLLLHTFDVGKIAKVSQRLTNVLQMFSFPYRISIDSTTNT